MTESKYDFRDPRRLFELWKELTGEDLLSEPLSERIWTSGICSKDTTGPECCSIWILHTCHQGRDISTVSSLKILSS